jgi:2-isopropylmalate synthase
MAEQRRGIDAAAYRLELARVQTGTGEVPEATVQITAPDGAKHSQTSNGDGPVDAVCRAIAEVIGVQPELDEFNVHSITGGMDAVGEVTIRVRYNGCLYSGRGADTDIIVASAKAYINALNRLLALEGMLEMRSA